MNEKPQKNRSVVSLVITAAASMALTLAVVYATGLVHIDGPATSSEIEVPGHEGHGHDEDNPLWTCGMHPWIVTEEEGLCPICNMELTPMEKKAGTTGSGQREVAFWKDPDDPSRTYKMKEQYTGTKDPVPVYEDQLIGGVDIQIDPVIEQNMGIRTATVKSGPLVNSIRTYGHIAYDETRTVHVSLKFSGWIETLHADYVGRHVKAGEPLFEIYSPELFAVQEEYLSALRSSRGRVGSKGKKTLLEMQASARRRLLNFGIDPKEINTLEKSGKVARQLIIRSPYDGVITAKNVAQGAFVKTGAQVFTISDLSRVWVEAHIFEYEVSRLAIGQKASMSFPYLPGRVFEGEVSYIYPYLQKKTRDVIVRLEFENPGLVLKPDMYANVTIHAQRFDPGMYIDSEAVIRSGETNLVFVYKGQGRFIPRKVVLGMELDEGQVEILSGLAPDEIIVTSGQFLLDSESKLKETILKMMDPEHPPAGLQEDSASGEDDFFNDMQSDDDGFFDDMES
ncbi:MAG: efflux RND transporter periplasmic adaptor subunit [Desulfobacteraceae bacterium]|nr:MAG: efflux RND transporter periplasmic adaptor subunit [Desulfobacteraceae bacterium]